MEQNISEMGKYSGYPSIDRPWLKYYTREQIHTPLPKCRIFDYVWQENRDHLKDTAINYFDKRISYASMFKNIECAAKSFQGMGIGKGEIVVIVAITIPETIYALYGLNRIGAVANLIDPRTSEMGIREYVEETSCKTIIVQDVVYEKVKKSVRGTTVKNFIVISAGDSLPVVKKILYNLKNKSVMHVPEKKNSIQDSKQVIENESLMWSNFIQYGKGKILNESEYEKDRCCVIVHTGGTTGMPKGVMLSDDNLNAAAQQSLKSPLPLDRKDCFLNIMPPFIAYGVVLGIHTVFVGGMKNILVPKLDSEKIGQLILKYKPSCIMGVPTHFDNIRQSKKMKGKDLSFLKVVLVGGDKIKEETENEVNHFLAKHGAKLKINTGYSMTEASATALFSFQECSKIGSAGIPLAKTEIAVSNDDLKTELPYGEKGVLFLKTPTLMMGYYEKKEETEAVFRVKSDGTKWLYTGDIGYVDKDGCVFVEGREKRMIIRYDGFKVFPPMIEKVIEKEAEVKACCVVGAVDEIHSQGKLPIAYIILKNDNSEKRGISSNIGDFSNIKEQIVKRCLAELPEYAQPKEIIAIDCFPVTAIGKVDFMELERMYQKEKR